MRLEFLDNWFALLRDADPVYGVPLVLIGLVLMFIGWSMHKVAVPFIFVLVGIIAGQTFFAETTTQWIAGGVIGVILAALSSLRMQYSVSLLGGLACAFALSAYLTIIQSSHLQEVIYWGAAGLGFVAGTALAFIMFREMSIVVTSFVGTLFLVSGLTAIMPQSLPTLHETITTFLEDYPALLMPFLIGGPTLIAVLVQLANAHRVDAGAA